MQISVCRMTASCDIADFVKTNNPGLEDKKNPRRRFSPRTLDEPPLWTKHYSEKYKEYYFFCHFKIQFYEILESDKLPVVKGHTYDISSMHNAPLPTTPAATSNSFGGAGRGRRYGKAFSQR